MPRDRYAILLDGGFVIKKLHRARGKFPVVADVISLCSEIQQHERLKQNDLYRMFFYDCPPLEQELIHPLSRKRWNLKATSRAKNGKALHDGLEQQEDFALRRGELSFDGWKLGYQALRHIQEKTDGLSAEDLVPDLTQKGVDLRIGLDIATLALRRIVGILVLVTGDSDFIPAMKLARREGLKVYLHPLDHGVKSKLKAHADFVFP